MTDAPTLCFTFDRHDEAATVAFGIMNTYGLFGTYFVEPTTIDAVGGPTLNTLIAMKECGWEIGAYLKSADSTQNMVAMLAAGRITANNRLRDLKEQMRAKGLPVTVGGAGQRQWNSQLAYMARGHFDCVRVASEIYAEAGHWQALPVEDMLYIKGGGTDSVNNANSTATTLCDQLDSLIAEGGMWSPVFHRVSNDASEPDYTVSITTFTGFCQYVSAQAAAGNVRVARYGDF